MTFELITKKLRSSYDRSNMVFIATYIKEGKRNLSLMLQINHLILKEIGLGDDTVGESVSVYLGSKENFGTIKITLPTSEYEEMFAIRNTVKNKDNPIVSIPVDSSYFKDAQILKSVIKHEIVQASFGEKYLLLFIDKKYLNSSYKKEEDKE